MEYRKFNEKWKKYKLYDLATWKNGLAFKQISFSNKGYPIIKIAELKNGITKQTNYTKQNYDKDVFLSYDDLIFSWSGNPETSIDAFLYRLPDGYLNQHSFKVTPKEGIDKYFLYYILKYLKPVFKLIATNKQTTGLGHVTIGNLKELDVAIPDYVMQRKILKILKDIDDKIELNKKINNNLYELGDAIYKELILDKYDKTNKLSNLYRFQYGKGNNNPSNGGKYPVYGSNGVIGGYDEFNNEDAPVIGHIGANCGSLIFAYGKHYVTYNGIMCNIINSNYRYFGYETLRFLNIRREIRGSSQPFISYDLLNSFDIPLPQNSIIVNIENKLKTIYTSIKNNLDEINTLMQLRDTLLPKLMNGEIDLEKIEW